MESYGMFPPEMFFLPSIMPLRFIHVVCINTSFLFYFKLSVYIFLLSLDEQFKHG